MCHRISLGTHFFAVICYNKYLFQEPPEQSVWRREEDDQRLLRTREQRQENQGMAYRIL